MKAREVCACGGSATASGETPAAVADAIEAWRTAHACDRRPAAEHQADALVEQAPTSPAGFALPPEATP